MTGQWPIGDDSKTDHSDWEWIGPDGLTDSQREALTPEDIERILSYKEIPYQNLDSADTPGE
jgi:hypothetical protein